MVSRLRLVLVTRSFWPLADCTSLALGELAAGLQRRDVDVTVLTPLWQPRWPAQVDFRGARVVRLSPPPLGACGGFQYPHALSRWLRRHRREYDVVCVSQLRQDAHCVLKAARDAEFPVALRAERAGIDGDCHWQLQALSGRRIKRLCAKADALLALGPVLAGELIAAGFPRDRIVTCRPGVVGRPLPSPGDRSRARQTLASVHSLLSVPSGVPLAVTIDDLYAGSGLEPVIRQWPSIMGRWPGARLWLVGEGPHKASLARLVQQLGLVNYVLFPGSFDDPDDVLRAADVYVAATRDAGPQPGLLSAMSAGLPIVASDIPAHRQLLTAEVDGLIVPAGADRLVTEPSAASEAWSESIARLLTESDLALRLGASAAERARREFDFDNTVDDHLAVLQRIAGSRRSRRNGPSAPSSATESGPAAAESASPSRSATQSTAGDSSPSGWARGAC